MSTGNRPDITVRTARAEDLETLVAHNLAMARETEGRELDPETVRAGTRELLEQTRRGFYLLAELPEGPAGQLMVTYEWSDWRNGDFWWIQSVYVRPDARRRGVFSALLRWLVERAGSDARVCGLRLYVHRENSTAQQTYRRLGLQPAPYLMYERD